MQGFIGIPFALGDRKMFIRIIIEIGAAAHSLVGISFPPTDDIKVAVKFKSKFNSSLMLDLSPECNLISKNNIGQ